jgi:hypothetical protein
MTTPRDTDAIDDRRAAYVSLLRQEDILRTFVSTPDDVLIALGAHYALAAYQGTYEREAYIAVTQYRIPEDAVELLAAAYLVMVLPALANVVLGRPNEGTVLAARGLVRRHGIDLPRA